jgi:hypothetical protein
MLLLVIQLADCWSRYSLIYINKLELRAIALGYSRRPTETGPACWASRCSALPTRFRQLLPGLAFQLRRGNQALVEIHLRGNADLLPALASRLHRNPKTGHGMPQHALSNFCLEPDLRGHRSHLLLLTVPG